MLTRKQRMVDIFSLRHLSLASLHAWYAMNEKALWGEMNILKSFHTDVYIRRKWEVFWIFESIKNVFIYFVNFNSMKLSNIFSKIISWYLIPNKNDQSITVEMDSRKRSKTIFLSLLLQNILRILKHLPKLRSLYMRETLHS